MNDMMSNTLAVKTEKAATRRCLALLLWSGVARGDSVRQCKVPLLQFSPCLLRCGPQPIPALIPAL
ncbi:hypothetical protein HaLaN_31094 [Haematococcus lacustris]|uniref:Uncharacterized protein n=1 Tax=Haematococcus lacustris TaxID=44745 RepID=A0A6A0AGU2_HAELA|nr:hypothetical protein HaLaN_31094 [Haematococcus lacustris]